MSAPAELAAWLEQVRADIDVDLASRLPAARGKDDSAYDAIDRLHDAMRYAVLGGGKRLRPAMALAACEAVGGTAQQGYPAAAAVEILHAYTLVHDDLPALDDDDERRGRPTVHVAYDEATAVLVGDALLTAAFGSLANLGPRAGDAVGLLAQRAGSHELIGGQCLDLELEQQGSDAPPPDLATVERVHRNKTGALFSAAAELGAIAGGGTDEDRTLLANYGMAVGIAFQYADDRDDGDFDELAEAARAQTRGLVDAALAAIDRYGQRAWHLRSLASWIGSRV